MNGSATAWRNLLRQLCLLGALAQSQDVAAADVATRLSNVTLIQEPCAAYDPAELVRLLALELSARGVGSLALRERLDKVQVSEAGLAVVHLRCDAEHNSVLAEVADLTTGNQTRRDMPLADLVPAARARVLSLAVTALIEASWLELALSEPKQTAPDGLPAQVVTALRQRVRSSLEPVAALPRAEPPARAPESAFALLTTARTHPSRSTGLLGVELMYTPLLARTRFSASAEALMGGAQLSDLDGGIARMQLYSLGTSFALAWASATRPELSFGPCVRLGYGAATASSLRTGAAAHGGGGFFATAGARALMRAELTEMWDLWLGFDLGYTLSGLVFEAGAHDTLGMTDLTFALHAGLGVRR